MHQNEMQQSNIYLGIYIIGYYFFWKNQGVTHLDFQFRLRVDVV
jgi:hypothetical protein